MKFLVLLTALTSLLSELSTKTLQSDISISVQEQGQAAMTTPGKVVMQGERFAGSARGYEVAYDGSTFYLYDPDTKELTLSRPIAEELMSSNPLLYAQYISEVSDIRESVNKDGTITTIVMIPKGTPDAQMRVTIKVKKGMVQSVEIKESNRTTTLRFKNPEYITTTPSFVISKPGVYINDLR